MPVTDRERDMLTLRNLIDEARAVITMAYIPKDRAKRVSKILSVALELTDDLIAAPPEASIIGKRGGDKTAQRGADYFREIAGKRKKLSGGIRRAPL